MEEMQLIATSHYKAIIGASGEEGFKDFKKWLNRQL